MPDMSPKKCSTGRDWITWGFNQAGSACLVRGVKIGR